MKLLGLKKIGGLLLVGVLTLPAWATRTPQVGSLNYLEGQATIGEQPLDSQSVGSVALQPGQSLSTSRGKAEILLTPGVFFRLDDMSSARMVSASLINTEVALEHGRAMVEVTDLRPQNDLRIDENGVTVQLHKTGLYDFDAEQNQLRVFHGKAVVIDQDRTITIDGGHQINFSDQGKWKSKGFDRQPYEQTDLYRWSSLRSSYLAEANVDAARTYVNGGYYGPGWFGAGWYWDPWFGTYTFLPAAGIFYSPFGWGFFSPLVVYRAPVFFAGPPFVHRFGPAFRPPVLIGRPGMMGPARMFPGPVAMGRPGFGEHGGGFGGGHVGMRR